MVTLKIFTLTYKVSVLLTVIYNCREEHSSESSQSPKAVSEVGECLITFCTASAHGPGTASIHCPGYL